MLSLNSERYWSKLINFKKRLSFDILWENNVFKQFFIRKRCSIRLKIIVGWVWKIYKKRPWGCNKRFLKN